MERKELESETIGSWDGDIAEYTDFHNYYLKEEADAVIDALEARIKKLEVINKDLIKDRNKTYNIYESRIKELEEQSNKWEQDAYRQDERCLEFKKKYEKLEASQPKWISFEDKVPTMYQNILVNVPGANKENRMEPTRSIFWCPAREEELKVGLLYYTHWMPLPMPPKEE